MNTLMVLGPAALGPVQQFLVGIDAAQGRPGHRCVGRDCPFGHLISTRFYSVARAPLTSSEGAEGCLTRVGLPAVSPQRSAATHTSTDAQEWTVADLRGHG